MGERPVSFDQTDLDDMLAKMGFTDDILYIDRISKKVLAEMGHMFIE